MPDRFVTINDDNVLPAPVESRIAEVVEEAGYITADPDTGALPDVIEARIASISGSAASSSVLPSLTQITTWGESTSAPATGWHTLLGNYTGLTVNSRGVSGQGSTDVLLRMGVFEPRVTLAGNQIPASGPVAITAIDPAVGWRRMSGAGSYTFAGTLAGIPGTLTNAFASNANTFTFTRTASGDPVPVPAGTPFKIDPTIPRRNERAIVWTGRNNVTSDDMHVIDALLRLTPAALTAASKDVLALGVLNGTDEPKNSGPYKVIVASNTRRQAAFGDRFLDIRRGFIDRGLTIRGIAPTIADQVNIANDCPPPSLMADNIHPNADGYAVVAYLVAEKLLELGWISSITLPPIPTPPPPTITRTTYTSDSFNRADTSPGTLGNTDAALGGTAKAWEVDSGLQVISNQLGVTTAQAIRRAMMVMPTADHGVKMKLTGTTVPGQRLYVRYADASNNIAAQVRSGPSGLILTRIVAGSQVSLAEYTDEPLNAGDVVALEVQGSEVRVFVNDTPRIVKTLTSSEAPLAANVRAGWGSVLNNAGGRADDAVFYSVANA